MNAVRGAACRQAGVTAVEFALVLPLLLMLLLGIAEFGRHAWLLHAGAEATRVAARVGATCSPADLSQAAEQGASVLPASLAGALVVEALPAGCTASGTNACTHVTARIDAAAVSPLFGTFVAAGLELPDMTHTLPRESMDSADNDLCQP